MIFMSVKMALHNPGCLLIFLLIFLSVAALTSGFQDNSLYGISHVTQVVSDLDLSTRYYTQVLGGMLVPKLSTGRDGINGDDHFHRFFYKEYEESREQNIPLLQLGVPDIRARGGYNVRWNFIMFNNLAIQLVQFINRYSRQPYIQKDPKVGSGWVGSTFLSFIADERIIPLQQVENILKKLEDFPEMEEKFRGFSTNERVGSFKDRRTAPLHSLIHPLSLDHLRARTQGPDGEPMEILYFKGNASDTDFRTKCKYRAVAHELLDIPTRNKFQDSLSKKLAGLKYLLMVVDDNKKSDKFYSGILGGQVNPKGNVVEIDDSWLNMAHQDDILEANHRGVLPDENFGIPTLRHSAKPTYDFTGILFDNTVFTHYPFKVNDITNDPNNLTAIFRNWTSPAYINNRHYAFWVKEDIDMETFVQTVERQSWSNGLNKVLFNQASTGSNVNMYESPFSEGDLQGFNYLYFKGPSGETVALSQFKGKAKAALQAAMEKYGALSTAFPSTNPWNWDGFSRTCDRILH